MLVEIYHFDMSDPRFRNNPLFLPSLDRSWPVWPNDYKLVAYADVSDDFGVQMAAERAFWATQNDYGGKSGKYVTWMDDLHRSTSSGDVVKFPSGEVLRSLALGWETLVTILEAMTKEE